MGQVRGEDARVEAKDIKFIFDEWGARFPLAGGRHRPGRTGMVTPLTYANFLHEMFRHSGMIGPVPRPAVSATVFRQHGRRRGSGCGWLVIKLLRAHFAGALPVASAATLRRQPMRGTPFVDMGPEPTGSPTYPLDVVAAFPSDRKKLILSVVNPSGEARVHAQITGVKLRGPGKLSQIAAPSVNADERGRQGTGGQNRRNSQRELRRTVQVPPISVSVYEFDVEKG